MLDGVKKEMCVSRQMGISQQFAIRFMALFLALFLTISWGGGPQQVMAAATGETVYVEKVAQPYLGMDVTFGRWNSAIVWAYNPTGAPEPFTDRDRFVELLKEAMAEWEGVSGITFEYQGINTDLTDVDDDNVVAVYWDAISASAMAGPSRSWTTDGGEPATSTSAAVLGYDPYTDGSIQINNSTSKDWTSGNTTAMAENSLRGTLVHEVGHLIGLGHSDNPVSIMYANPYNGVLHLLDDDIAAAQAFYGQSSSPSTVAAYSPPTTTGTSPFTEAIFYLNPEGSSVLNTGEETAVTEIDQSVNGGDALVMKLKYNGPQTDTLAVYVVDPTGYVTTEMSIPLACDSGVSCWNYHSVGSVETLKAMSGDHHVYVTANDELLADLTYTVTGTLEWNQPPEVTELSVSAGTDPLTANVTLTATDPEDHAMTATWYIPGTGVVAETDFTGTASHTMTFAEAGTYTFFVTLSDDQSRYQNTSGTTDIGNPASGAGDGVQTLVRQEITVTETEVTAGDGTTSVTTGDGTGSGAGDATEVGSITLTVHEMGNSDLSGDVPVKGSLEYPALNIVGEDGNAPTEPFALFFMTPDGGLGWRVDDIPAGTTAVTLGVLPEGATEVAPYISSDAAGTYMVTVYPANPADWGEVDDSVGSSTQVWNVEDGVIPDGQTITFTIQGLETLTTEQQGGQFGCFVGAGDQQVLRLVQHDGSDSMVIECQIPEAMAALDWYGDFFYDVDSNANGSMDDSDFYIEGDGFSKEDADAEQNQFTASVVSGAISGAVLFVDEDGNSVDVPEDTLMEVRVSGVWVESMLDVDGSFSADVVKFVPEGDSLDLSLLENFSLLRDVDHDGWSPSDHNYVGLNSPETLGTMEEPLVTMQATPIQVTVEGIDTDEQWIFVPTGQVLTQSSNIIDGSVFLPTPEPENSWWSSELVLDQNANGVKDSDEGHIYVGNKGIASDPISVADVKMVTFQYRGFDWYDDGLQVDMLGWNRAGSNTFDDGPETVGSGVVTFLPNDDMAEVPTEITLYKDVNHNWQYDANEPSVTLPLPELSGRYYRFADILDADELNLGAPDGGGGVTISVDGDNSDWEGIDPVVSDPAEDVVDTTATGLDITGIFITKNATNLYLRVDRAGTDLPTSDMSNIWLYFRPMEEGGPGYAVELLHSDGSVQARLHDISANPADHDTYVLKSETLEINTSSTSIEVAIPLDLVDVSPSYMLDFHSHHTVDSNWEDNGDMLAEPVQVALGEIGGDNFAGTILGAWQFADSEGAGVVTFMANGSYMMAESGTADESGESGIEFGTYTWDADTGELAVTVEVDTNGEWGLSHPDGGGSETVQVNLDSLQFSDGTTLDRVIADEANPLVGSWFMQDQESGKAVMLTFLDNGKYFHAEVGQDEGGQNGVEYGEFGWDAANGISVTVITDTNGEWGLSHLPDAKPLFEVDETGGVLTITDGTEVIQLKNVSKTDTSGDGTDSNKPVVTNPLDNQTWSGSGRKNFELPDDLFAGAEEGDELDITVSLSDGTELPDWLYFSSTNGSLSGNPPEDASELSIKVTATDANGESVSSEFTLAFADTADVELTPIAVTGTVTVDGIATQEGTALRFWPLGMGDMDETPPTESSTSDTGAFTVSELLPGTYMVEVQPSDHVSVWLGLDENDQIIIEGHPESAMPLFIDTDVNQTLGIIISQDQLVALVVLSGTVTLDGNAAEAAEIRLEAAGEGRAKDITALTDSVGLYSVSVAPDSYEISVQISGNTPLLLGLETDATSNDEQVVVEENPDNAAMFFVDSGLSDWSTIDVALLSEQLVPLVTLTGTVKLGDALVENAGVALFRMDDDADEAEAKAVTNAEGIYSITVAPGLYGVAVQLENKAPLFLGLDEDTSGQEVIVVELNPDNAFGFFVDGGEGHGSVIDITLAEEQLVALVSLDGMVQMGENAAPGIEVRLFPAGELDAPGEVVVTDASGFYSFEVAPGLYGIEVQQAGMAPVFLGLSMDDQVVAENNSENAHDFFVDRDGWAFIDVTLDPEQAIPLIELNGVVKAIETEGTDAVEVAGATVSLSPAGAMNAPKISAVTDADGLYVVDLVPGLYTIEVQLPGTAPLFLGLMPDESGETAGTVVVESRVEQAHGFFVDGAESWPTINMTVAAGQAIPLVAVSGIVKMDDMAEPGAEVHLIPDGAMGMSGVVGVTDADGEYHVDVAPGLYRVEVQVSGKAPLFLGMNDAGDIVIESRPEKSHGFFVATDEWVKFDVALTQDQTVDLVELAGSVMMGDKPVPGVSVLLHMAGAEDAQPMAAVTGPSGMYDINVAPGLYEIELQLPGKAPLYLGLVPDDSGTMPGTVHVENNPDKSYGFFVADDQWHTIDIMLSGDQAISLLGVTGVVKLGEQPVAGAAVRFYPSVMDNLPGFESVTNAAGLYDINVAPGLYDVEVQIPGKASLFLGVDFDEETETENVTIEDSLDDGVGFFVGLGGWETIDITLDPEQLVDLVELNGSVTVDEQAVAGAEVRLFPMGEMDDVIAEVATDTAGLFSLDVAPGLYGVEVQIPGKAPLFLGLEMDETTSEEMIVVEQNPELANGFFVGEGERTELNVTFAADQAVSLVSVTGVVKVGETVAPGAEVRLYSVDFEDAEGEEGVTDAAGQYSIAVAPGLYGVEVQIPGMAPLYLGVDVVEVEGAEEEVVVVEQSPEKAYDFFVADGAWHAIDIMVGADQVVALVPVTGMVKMGMEGIPGAEVVFAMSGAEDGPVTFGVTGVTGHYDLQLAPGPYKVAVNLPGKATLYLGIDYDAAGMEQVVVEQNGENAHSFFVEQGELTEINVMLDPNQAIELAELSGVVKVDDLVEPGIEIHLYSVGMENASATTVVTNADGQYDVNVPPGLYDIEVQLPGKAPLFLGLNSDEQVVVEDRQEKAHSFFIGHEEEAWHVIDISLVEEMAVSLVGLSGTVKVGENVKAGVLVRLSAAGDENARMVEGSTNVDGLYSMDVAPGSYMVEVQVPGKAAVFLGLSEDESGDTLGSIMVESRRDKAFDFFIGEGEGAWQTLDVMLIADQLIALAELHGTVMIGEMEAPGAEVTLSGVEEDVEVMGVTNADGQYNVNVAPGIYEITVELPGQAPLFLMMEPDESGETEHIVATDDPSSAYGFLIGAEGLQQVDITLEHGQTMALTDVHGSVHADDMPVAGAEVHLISREHEGAAVVKSVTDAAGEFDINVAPGLYTVEVQLPGKAPLFLGIDFDEETGMEDITVEQSAEDAFDFFIGDEEWQNLGIRLEQDQAVSLVNLTGTIKLAETAAAGAVVRLWSYGELVAETVTDAEGGYDLNVPPGVYLVEIQLPGKQSVFVSISSVDQSNQSVAKREDAFPFAMGGADGSEAMVVDLVLQADDIQSLLEVAGLIQMQDGEETLPVSRALVLFSPVGQEFGMVETITDSSGQYDINIAPGLYVVEVQPDGAVPMLVGENGVPVGTCSDSIYTTKTTCEGADPAGTWVENAAYFQLSSESGTAGHQVNLIFNKAALVSLVEVSGNIMLEEASASTSGSDDDSEEHMKAAVGAQVYLTQMGDSEQVWQATTNSSGDFDLDVPPGVYRVRVQAQGFVEVYVARDAAGFAYPNRDSQKAAAFDFRPDSEDGNTIQLFLSSADLVAQGRVEGMIRKLDYSGIDTAMQQVAEAAGGSIFDEGPGDAAIAADEESPDGIIAQAWGAAEEAAVPAAGTEVTLWMAGVEDAAPVSTTTGGNGKFGIGVPPGIYHIEVQIPGSAPIHVGRGMEGETFPAFDDEEAAPFEVEGGEQPTTIHLDLPSNFVQALAGVHGTISMETPEGEANPLAGAELRFLGQGDDESRAEMAVTDGVGQYSTGLADGGYVVEISIPAHTPAFVSMGETEGTYATVLDRDEAHTFFIQGDDASSTDGTDISVIIAAGSLPKLVELTGKVTLDGEDIAGALVHLYDVECGCEGSVDEVETGFDGSYAIYVAPGIYHVEAVAHGFTGMFNGIDEDGAAILTDKIEDAVIVDVQGEGEATLEPHNFNLASEGMQMTVEIRGQVTRPNGMPVSGITIKIHPVDGISGNAIVTVTGPDGGYDVSVAPGLYRVEASEAGFAGVFPASFDDEFVTTEKDDAALYEAEGAVIVVDMELDQEMGEALLTISGKITTDGTTPRFGVKVKAYPEDTSKSIVHVLTDADGRYKLSVQPGSYRIRAIIEGAVPVHPFEPTETNQSTLTWWRSQSILYELDESNITVSMIIPEEVVTPLVELSGTVTDETSLPIQGADVVAHRYSNSQGQVTSHTFDSLTDQDGKYSIAVYPGSKYVVELNVPGFISVMPELDNTTQLTSDPVAAHLFEIAENQVFDMVFPLASAIESVEIFGQVIRNGEPVVGAELQAHPTVQSSETGEAKVILGEFSAVTDVEGHYAISVEPGLYSLELMMSGFKAAFVSDVEGQPLTSNLDDAQRYDVQQSTEANIVLGGDGPGDMAAGMEREAVSMTVKVTDPAGQGVAGVLVVMEPENDSDSKNGNGEWAEGKTDADGKFTATVMPGRYRIEAQTKFWDWTLDDYEEDGVTEKNKTVEILGTENLIAGFADGHGGVNPDWDTAKIFTIFSSSTVNIQLAEGVTLSGVVEIDGTAIQGAEVNVHTTNNSGSFWAETDAEGAFSISVNPGERYVVEVWPAWCDEESTDFATCDAGRASFVGGNYIVTNTDVSDATIIHHNSRNEPIITASTANTAGVAISGKVLGVWDPEKVTQLKVDQNLRVTIGVEQGTELKGRLVHLVDGVSQGIANAWVESGLGGSPTDTNGNFTLTVSSSSGGGENDPGFKVQIWPPWCDDQDENYATCESGKVDFIGGVVVGSEGAYVLSTDDASAVHFMNDGSNWPEQGAGVLTVTASGGISISGTVLNNSQQGVPGVWVDAWSDIASTGNGSSTNGDGQFSMSVETPVGEEVVYYEVNVWADGFVAPEPRLVKVEASGVTGVYTVSEEDYDESQGSQPGEYLGESVAFELSMGNTIKGRVVDASGQGLPWMWVDIHDKRQTKFFGDSTDEDGYYEVSVEPGRYVAVVWGDGDAYRDTWYDQGSDEKEATEIDVQSESQSDINFLMSSGASISGTIEGGTSGEVFVGVWSRKTQSWGGKDVTLESDGSTDFTISGLREANDYRLEWDAEGYMSGYYGGTAGDAASGPVSWHKATKISTKTGNVTGVNLSLGSGKTLTLTVTGLTEGDAVDASAWSDSLDLGNWAEGKAGSDGVATLQITDLDSTGMDYRVFVDSSTGNYKTGTFKGVAVTTTDTDLTDGDATDTVAGSLVGWDQGIDVNMSENVSIKVTMGTGASIEGTVSGMTAGQIAWIDAFSPRTHGWGGTEVTIGSDGTAAYAIKGLKQANDFRVSISGDGVKGGFYGGSNSTKLVRWRKAAKISVSSANATGINLPVSSDGVTIEGAIKGSGDSDGLQSGEWAWVDAWSDSTYSWAGTTVEADTDSPGISVAYKLSGLTAAADYEIHLDAAGYVQQTQANVNATSSKTGIDFTLSTGGKISGSLSGLSASEFAWVDAYSPSSDMWSGVGVNADTSGAATYTIDGVSAATDYILALETEGKRLFYKSDGITPKRSEHSAVTVTSGTTEGINFDLSTASSLVFSLSGTITLSPDDSDQVVEVMAWSSEEDGSGAQISRVGGGTFTLNGLPSGSYNVGVFADGYITQLAKAVTVASGVVDSSSLTWTSGWSDMGTVAVAANTTELNVTLSTGYTISGSVTGSTESALSSVWVNAWDKTNAIGAGAITDSSGAYSIEGLPSGTYQVEVWTSDGDKSVEVTLGSENVTQDLVLTKEAGGISGTVTDSAGAAKSGAMVLVYSSGSQVAATVTDSSGAFTVTGLAAGTYTVKVFGGGDFSTTYSYQETSVTVESSTLALDSALQLSAASGS